MVSSINFVILRACGKMVYWQRMAGASIDIVWLLCEYRDSHIPLWLGYYIPHAMEGLGSGHKVSISRCHLTCVIDPIVDIIVLLFCYSTNMEYWSWKSPMLLSDFLKSVFKVLRMREILKWYVLIHHYISFSIYLFYLSLVQNPM